ncbi:MAG: hypothetical protein HFJ27_04925 [Clostridia bacterium]|nr:hypothetical protein [Clostridia bacterium]
MEQVNLARNFVSEQQSREGQIRQTMAKMVQDGTVEKTVMRLRKEELEERRQEQKEALKVYTVPYSVDFLTPQEGETSQPYDIDAFLGEKGTEVQIAIKYETVEQDEKRQQLIILATGPRGEVEVTNTTNQVREFFEKVQEFNTLEGIEPEKYIDYLQKKNWKVTKEGLEVFSTIQKDGNIEIQRTIFTEHELDTVSQEDIQDNIKRHIMRREQNIIDKTEKYLSKMAKQGVSNIEQDIVEYIFDKFKPIYLSQKGNSEETKCILQLNQYFARIPQEYKDSNLNQQLFDYIRVRMKELDLVAEQSEPKEAGDLYSFINKTDKEEAEKKAQRARAVLSKVRPVEQDKEEVR